MFNGFTLSFPKFKHFFLNVHHGAALVFCFIVVGMDCFCRSDLRKGVLFYTCVYGLLL